MLKRFVTLFGGDANKKEVEKYSPLIEQINSLESAYEALGDDALAGKTVEFRNRLAEGETLDDLMIEAFSAVREASKRTIGLRHYDVQMVGGAALHQGKIAEMRTGEGKTLVATLPLYLNALAGRGAHLITVNDYLARRDARWMGRIFQILGMSVGVLQMAARTENGKKAFLVDFTRESPHEDQHQLLMTPRREAYAADITYGTNSEFGFDYLRDNMTMRMGDRVQRGHFFAIVDEVDNILIDEARTPLIISGPASDNVEWYNRMAQVVRGLRPEDYEVSEKDRNVTLTEIGEAHVEELLGVPLRDPDRPEDVTHEQARLLGYLEQALRAQHLFHRNKDYLVQAGKVTIIDEFTGRLMPGRRWSDGLHQAVEAKEGVRVQPENVTYATITIQNYFRMYEKLAGMSGTAITEAEEFDKIYKLGVVAIPTNLEFQAMQPESGMVELEDRDHQGYKYRFYTLKDDPQKIPVYWKRKDYPDVVYRTEEMKLRAIMQEILHYNSRGRPLLVGTTSVELSDRVSARLRPEPLRRLVQVLLLRHTWFEKNKREEDGRQVPDLLFLNSPIDQLDPTRMRKLARELEIPFNPDDPANQDRVCSILNLDAGEVKRLLNCLQAGIQHQVLNARKHTEESQIIAGAGAFGAVTIATNMAGRGVDIKLGGELKEESIIAVNRVLHRSGHEDPYNLSLEERYQFLREIDPSEYGIYELEIKDYLRYMEEMEKVRALGGLHVIGSERHEARRIDNQLRGRAARQGDPGSSRFYLSMEDELMRLFGGGQADALMQRLKFDDAIPLEANLVSRLVESSQTRVEGANFDMRKHLLEYDDVLNTQRARIYSQRDLIFTKEDLSEDVADMLVTEVNRRVPEALQDEKEGPWRLLAWLDQVQPTISFNPVANDGSGTQLFPSYTLRLLIDEIWKRSIQTTNGVTGLPVSAARSALLEVARYSLEAEEEHIYKAFDSIIEQARQRYESTLQERLDILDTFFSSLDDNEEDTLSPRQLQDELSTAIRLPLRLSSEQLRTLREDPADLVESVRSQIQVAIFAQAATRVLGAITRRVEDELDALPTFPAGDWDFLSKQINNMINQALIRRKERLLGIGTTQSQTRAEIYEGQITRDLDNTLAQTEGMLSKMGVAALLLMLPEGARASFDKKTHRRIQLRQIRLTYLYYAAQLLENRTPEDITEEVLEHLQIAQHNIQLNFGLAEWNRLSAYTLSDLEGKIQEKVIASVGNEDFLRYKNERLTSLPGHINEIIALEFGRKSLTELYRQLLLSVISELWVDYLTQMESLRISIGLEAYAQRDPLVQYKSRASGLFQELLGNMRLGVVSRMFTFRPRDMSRIQSSSIAESTQDGLPGDDQPETGEIGAGGQGQTQQATAPVDENNLNERNKRRRRRGSSKERKR